MTTVTSTAPTVTEKRSPRSFWLISAPADFWLACAGGSLPLLLLLAVLHWYGNRELDFADLLLAELHLGATYDAIVRRRLWQKMPWDVLVIPLAILTLTYFLSMNGNRIFIFTVLMYLAVWHRGRQNMGMARFYQKQANGVISRTHEWLFLGAIYLPMAASVFFYTTAYPTHYEGEPYYPLSIPIEFMWGFGLISLLWVITYLLWTIGRTGLPGPGDAPRVHPAERWLILAHTVAFGSAYFLGAWNAAFIIVLAIHHEISYLYFAYAIARKQSPTPPATFQEEVRLLRSFAIWPLVGLITALVGFALMDRSETWRNWLGPSFVGLLLCHYWLDGRIWTRRAR